MNTYTTECIAWDDGPFESGESTPAQAAIQHAIAGWSNNGDPPDKPRDPVEVRVTTTAVYTVTWDPERGEATER